MKSNGKKMLFFCFYIIQNSNCMTHVYFNGLHYTLRLNHLISFYAKSDSHQDVRLGCTTGSKASGQGYDLFYSSHIFPLYASKGQTLNGYVKLFSPLCL